MASLAAGMLASDTICQVRPFAARYPGSMMISRRTRIGAAGSQRSFTTVSAKDAVVRIRARKGLS